MQPGVGELDEMGHGMAWKGREWENGKTFPGGVGMRFLMRW